MGPSLKFSVAVVAVVDDDESFRSIEVCDLYTPVFFGTKQPFEI